MGKNDRENIIIESVFINCKHTGAIQFNCNKINLNKYSAFGKSLCT
jgi:hypothetical protein